MTIAVFGGTGKTGQLFLEAALSQGYTVQALARTPEKVVIEHPQLQLVLGDARDTEAVARVIMGADLVVSFLGVNPKSGQAVFTRSLQPVFDSMKQQSVRRIILTAGAGVGDPEDKHSIIGSMFTGIIKLVARTAYEDGMQAAELVRSQSDIDWTMVRVPRLTDEPGSKDTASIRVGYLGRGTGFKLSREDLAAFVLENMQNNELNHQAPVISN